MEDFEAQQEDMRDECVECKCEVSWTAQGSLSLSLSLSPPTVSSLLIFLQQHGNITCRDMSANCPALSCNETEAEYIEGECCMKCPGQ